MLKSYKYKINPTDKQSELINKHIGSCRLLYNLALETKHSVYTSSKINLTYFDLMKQLPDLKKEYIWLKEINSQSLQQALVNLDKAFTNFFEGRSNFPKYKNKKNSQSFRIPQNILVCNNRLIIPKFKEGIKIILHRELKGIIKQATISKSTTGKYFVSILCDTGESNTLKQEIKENTTIGIDLGIKTFLTSSNGYKIENPKYLKNALSKLKYLQSKHSKHKGKRTKRKLAILHEKVSNKRKDFLQKTSTKLIRENQSIAIEDLQIKNMLGNHNLAQAIKDVSWGMFITMLKYKAEWYGINIIKIGKFEPSSKTCSCCEYVNKELTLKDRIWTCVNCSVTHDRDENAAINIKNFALKNYMSTEYRLKNQNELLTIVGVMTSEISTQKGLEIIHIEDL